MDCGGPWKLAGPSTGQFWMPSGARSPQPQSAPISATVAVWPLPLPLGMMITLMMTSPLPESLWHPGMEITTENEAVYNTVDDNFLTTVPMTVQDIIKEALDNKAAKNP